MIKPTRLIVLCGPAFSGKSTLAEALRGLGWIIVSLDAILRAQGHEPGQGLPPERWHAAFDVATRRVRGELSRERMVVVDDTAQYRFLRQHWRAVAACRAVGVRLVVLVASEALVRRRRLDNLRTRRRQDVAPQVFEAHLASFEWPSPDEPALRLDSEKPTPQLAARVTEDVDTTSLRRPRSSE